MSALKPLHALILCGGESRRMGQSKALMNYQQMPHYQYIAKVIAPLVDKVWVSCREDQAPLFPDLPLILDQKKWGQIGPINGVCAAFLQEKNVSWLVLGCDYPLLRDIDVQHLKANRVVDIPAVAYQNAESGCPEPLLAIYEAEVGAALQLWREQGNHSLRLFLQNIEARLILPLEPACLMSVDTPEIAQKLNLYPYPIRYI